MKQNRSWERWITRGESVAAYGLFLEYCQLGAERGLTKLPELAAKTGRKLNTLRYCYTKFHWVRRSRAYEEHLIKVEQKAIENTIKTDGVVWAKRELEYRHTANSLADDLIAKAREMLAAPLYLTKIEKIQIVEIDGEQVEIPTTVTMKPARWTFGTIKLLVEVADQIKRLSLNIPTSRSEVNININEMSAEERVKLARAKAAEWMANNLEDALNRVMNGNPNQDREKARTQLLDAVFEQFAKDFHLADGSLLEPYNTVTSLPLELESGDDFPLESSEVQ